MTDFIKPKKVKVLPPIEMYTTQAEWEKVILSSFAQHKKALQKNGFDKNGQSLRTFDLIDTMVKRRQKAVLNFIPTIYERYKPLDTDQSAIGKAWIEMNFPLITYSQMDAQSHILFAASIWILDQITAQEGWQKLFRLLPKDDRTLEDLYLHDAWDAEHEYDLIYSVEYVLRHRNPIEIDGADHPRTVTSEWLAKGNAEPSPNRKNYDALIAMIPQEAIDNAVARFRTLFWRWTDRFYEGLMPFIDASAKNDEKVRKSRIAYNKLVDEFDAAEERVEKLRRKKPKASAVIPLANPSRLNQTAFETRFDPLPALAWRRDPPKSEVEWAEDEALTIRMRVEDAATYSNDLLARGKDLYQYERTYSIRMTGQGRIMTEDLTDLGQIPVRPMEPMQVDDPYALCFALLYLTEADDDLPWLYGACCGLMGEVAEALPWGALEYDEMDDDIWEGEPQTAELPKSVQIPNAYERKYRMKGEELDLPRSLVQIIYEETGCILPRDLHIYDSRAKVLGKYGIKGKDAASALVLMSTLGSVRRSTRALNLSGNLGWLDDDLSGKKPTEGADEPAVDAAALKDEIKRLKAALHASEKESRETKKALTGIKAAAERERRELADLREYVFNSNQEEQAEETPDKTIRWPYEVQKNTLVFGGHDTWAKGIKGILTGNVRFIDKGFVFDTGIIRHADAIWIQPNALGHYMYYRIIDTARACNKAVRYFSFASWAKCAEQLVEGDR